MKILSVFFDVLQTDRQTDVAKLMGQFLQTFCSKEPKNVIMNFFSISDEVISKWTKQTNVSGLYEKLSWKLATRMANKKLSEDNIKTNLK
jgi:hypothetical protein